MGELVQYLTLGMDAEIYAAPVSVVREILDVRPISRLPQAPDYVLGMIDVRGDSVPVLDLRLMLEMGPGPDTDMTRIIVLTVDSGSQTHLIGLRADRVLEVTTLDHGELEPVPSLAARQIDRCVTGIGRRNGNFVTVFDIKTLLSGNKPVAELAA